MLNMHGVANPKIQIYAHRIYEVKTTYEICQQLFELSTQMRDTEEMMPGTGFTYPNPTDVVSDYFKYMFHPMKKNSTFDEMISSEPMQCVQLGLRVLVKLTLLDSRITMQQATIMQIHKAFARKSSVSPDMLCSILESMVPHNTIKSYDEHDGILFDNELTVPVTKITSDDFRQLCLVRPSTV